MWVYPARIFLAGDLAREMGWLFPRIAVAADSARVLVLFSARILFVAGLERDFKCFSARIATAADSAREMRYFPACPQEMPPPAPKEMPSPTSKKYPVRKKESAYQYYSNKSYGQEDIYREYL